MSNDSIDKDLLRAEYFHLQATVEEFDAKSLTIKAWSVSLSMAGVGAAYFQQEPIVLILAGLSALTFWLIEAQWKTFQYAYHARIREIEDFLSGKLDTIKVPQISTSWRQSWHAGGARRLFNVLTWPHVLLPHALIFFGSIILFFAFPPTKSPVPPAPAGTTPARVDKDTVNP
jgi:hypothetical protein